MTSSSSPVCLKCGSEIDFTPADSAVCRHCNEVYPKVLGIPDLRKQRTPESAFDAEVLEKIIKAFPTSSFSELLELWMAEHTFANQIIEASREYYQAQHERGRMMVDMFTQRASDVFHISQKNTVLDFGCGVGASFDALTQQFDNVIGIDLSLVSLILGKKYIEEKGYKNVQLIRAQGDCLPFNNQAFDFVVALNVLEHIFTIGTISQEIFRVLKSNGVFAGDSRNRYDLFLTEPHTHLRWLGFLPRPLMQKYAAWRTNNDYDDVYLLSYWDLRKGFKKTFGSNIRITFPCVEAYGYSTKIDRLVGLVEKIPLLGKLALFFFPSHLILARRP